MMERVEGKVNPHAAYSVGPVLEVAPVLYTAPMKVLQFFPVCLDNL